MRFLAAFTLVPALTSAFPTSASFIDLTRKQHSSLDNQEISTDAGAPPAFIWPSIHETTVAARRILKLHSISTLSTVFPKKPSSYSSSDDSSVTPQWGTPASVAGAPVSLMDYHASCNGTYAHDPVIIGVTIATTMRNAAAGSNVTLSMRYHLPSPPTPLNPPDPYAYLDANLPRFSLIGYIERLSDAELAEHKLKECFLRLHPDAELWQPGGTIEPHESWWATLRVQEVYFFGGFGDRNRIGWLPIEEWRGVSDEEVAAYRMIGEPGWEKVHDGYKERESIGRWALDVHEGVHGVEL